MYRFDTRMFQAHRKGRSGKRPRREIDYLYRSCLANDLCHVKVEKPPIAYPDLRTVLLFDNGRCIKVVITWCFEQGQAF